MSQSIYVNDRELELLIRGLGHLAADCDGDDDFLRPENTFDDIDPLKRKLYRHKIRRQENE